jgi:hypothetical protein
MRPTSLPHKIALKGHPLLLLLLAALGALLSVLTIGFEFGVYNNAYHIPYVLNLAEQEQFAQDTYYQSLKNYASGVWFLLRFVVNEGNIRTIFLISHYLIRFLAFIAFLLVLSGMGIKKPRSSHPAAPPFTRHRLPDIAMDSILLRRRASSRP